MIDIQKKVILRKFGTYCITYALKIRNLNNVTKTSKICYNVFTKMDKYSKITHPEYEF